ncbi:MAG: response regulator, partial [Dehalococcoidia bacterium]|nr:response regulator [Dehalococcoidia bacterium]
LKEARAKRPQLKGIIITAYPSVETAVEAMKIGAVDYLPKPFDPDALEKLIRETLGPVQVELKPKTAIEEAIVEAPAVEEAKVEEVIAITEEEIQVHLEQGKDHFKAERYGEAVREFQAILDIAPADIQTRIWIRKAKEELAKPRIEVPEGEVAVEEAVKPKECVWMKLGVVSYRLCTSDYDCLNCEFDQQMQERMASGEAPEIEEAMERFKELPGNQRLCRYALRGEISYRLCTRLFQCATCEFGQIMEDALQRKLAKLAVRREALRKKEKRGKVEA